MNRSFHLVVFIVSGLLSFSGAAQESAPSMSGSAPINHSAGLLPKDVLFEPGGGMRSRYFNRWSPTGGSFSDKERSSFIQSRFQADLLLHKGEFFQTFGRFLHINNWGRQSQATGDSNPATRDSFSSNNGLLVSEAWALWKVSENLGLKMGRSPLSFGRGLTYGANDWFDVPHTFDHFDIRWDWEHVEVSLVGAKLQELSVVSGQTISPDPEENHYILDVNIKDIADWVEVLDVHFAQINRDNGSADGGTSVLPALNVQRVGFDFAMTMDPFSGALFYGMANGKQRAATEGTVAHTALDLELGYEVHSAGLKVRGLVHRDSGDNDSTDTTDRHFDGFYYDAYGRSGKMDFLRWGNLTMMGLGFSFEIINDFFLVPDVIGADYYNFQKTKGNDGVELGLSGALLKEKILAGDVTLTNSTDLGSEFDFWLEWKFSSGVAAGGSLGIFQPGDALAKATTSSGKSISDNIYQLLFEVRFFF